MNNFESKELGRTFPRIFIVNKASTNPNDASNINSDSEQPAQVESKRSVINTMSSANIENSRAVSLAELFTNPSNYNGKKITVTGKVVKFNSNIMGQNWIHIVNDKSNYDLTIITNDVANLDDNVTFEGLITLNKDFGEGYKYAIIMEEGVIK